MKRLVVPILFLLVLNIALAQDQWYYTSKNVIVDINIYSGAKIIPKSGDYDVKYINVNLSHFPFETDSQKVLKFDITPDAEINDNTILFSWENPKNRIDYGYSARIKTYNNIIEIDEKIHFPILDLDEELERYVQPQENIDSNVPRIKAQATKLVEAQDDLYVVVHKIAEWTKSNIEYDLSTLTADVSQKASWVLINKQGVCDELTSLFIAMLRSVGIPAKFISGISYTNNSLFAENWGSHGWAEVYFPGYGWIPYDVTYGQFGYIDPAHIKMKESLDSADASVRYRWVASNVDDIDTEELDIKTTLNSFSGTAKNPLTMELEILNKNIGFGSHNLIEAKLTNLEDYYVSEEVYISKPVQLEIIGENFRTIYLKPKEKKSIFWIVRLTNDIDRNYIYTFPITARTSRGLEKNNEFLSTKKDIVYSYDSIKEILNQKFEEEKKIYSKQVTIECDLDKEEFYAYENPRMDCRIKNVGNVPLKDLNLCFEENCKVLDLGIIEEKSYVFPITEFEEGFQESPLTVKSPDVSKAEYIKFNVLDEPKVAIKDIIAPNTVKYTQKFDISFILEKESASIPKNIEITLTQNRYKKTWFMEELNGDRKFIINLIGKNLMKGTNEFKINIKFEDSNSNPFETEESFNIELVEVTLVQNILLLINQGVFILENLTIRSLIYISLATTIFFFIMVFIVFRRRY